MADGRGSHARRERYPMPDDVREALIRRALDAAYAERPPYQRNDYLGWIGAAKRPETREKRLAQMLDELEGGERYMNMPCRAKQSDGERQSPDGNASVSTYFAEISVMLKPLVNDPQGLAVRDGLHNLGFAGVERVRVGKRIEVTIEAADAGAAEHAVREMCDKLLANPVIERFEFELHEHTTAG